MAVAHDASSESATFTTTTPATWTHTPTGTPAGVIVAISHAAVSTDLINGTVSYGGVAMERVGTAADASGEPGRSYLYFLGAGIPTGAQTVSISHTGSSDVKWAACATVTASADTEAGPGVWRNANDTNPTAFVNKGVSGMAYGVAHSGVDAIASLVPNAAMTHLQDNDFGTQVASFDRETSVSSTFMSFGYTASSDDSAICVINVIEKGSGIRALGGSCPESTANTTSFTIRQTGSLAGKNMYVFAISRDSTSASADVTCTDDSGVGSWTSKAGDADKKLWVWWKLGTASDVGCTITVAAAVGSCAGGTIVIADSYVDGDPTTNLSLETNASGNETHAEITPSNADSLIVASIGDYGNDTNAATSMTVTTPGTMEPEIFDQLSTGGSDCRIIATAKPQVGGPTATGAFTWSQTNSTTKSVLFAVRGAVTVTPATVTPAATARSFGVNTVTAKGKAVQTVAATVRSFTVDAPSAKGAAKTQPVATARSFLVLDATAIVPDSSATVTPAQIAWAATLAATVQVGRAVVQPSATALVFLVPQVIPKSPATVAPGVTARSITLPVVTVKGSTLVSTGMTFTIVLPAPTLKTTVRQAAGSIDLAAIASQVTIIVEGGDDWNEILFVDAVW